MTSAKTTLTQRTGFLVHQLHCVLLPAIEDGLTDLELDTRSYFVLASIDQPTPPSQQDLARSLRIDPTTMVAVVDQLESLGYITRMRNASDRRRYDLHLAPAGVNALARAEKAMDVVEEDFFGPISASEKRSLHRLLEKLLANR